MLLNYEYLAIVLQELLVIQVTYIDILLCYQ